MSRLRQAVWRIGSVDAVTWLSFWLTFAAVVIGSLIVMPTGVSFAVRLAIFGVGQLVLWVPLLIARSVALRMDPSRRTAIAFVILGAFCIGAAVRTLVIGFIYIGLLGPEAGLWVGRTIGSFGTMGLVFAVTAYFVSIAREQRHRIHDLEEVQVALEQSVLDARVDIGERGEQSVQRVRGILESELAGLQSADAGASVESLERLGRDVVRPLSHELADAVSVPPVPAPRTGTTVSWRAVVDLASRGKPFNPLAVALLILLTALGAIGSYPPATLRFLPIPVVTFIVLTAANPLVARTLEGRPLRVRATILLLASAACGALVAAVAFGLLTGQPVRTGAVVGSFFFVTVFSLAVAVISALGTDRTIMIARLEVAAAQLRRNLALVNQVRWFQEKALSRALHGPVQTAIAAAAFRLDSAMRSGVVTTELIDRVRGDVSRELDVLADVTRTSLALDAGLESIVATWDGVCRIETDVDPEVSDLVAQDAPLRACAIAIATESVSNAIRHGKSTSAQLRFRLDRDAAEVIVEMESRCPPRGEVAPSGATGLGTRQLDECATSWALEVGPEGQHLRVALPARHLLA